MKLIGVSEIMSASLPKVSTDDGPSHANTSQEKVLSKETGDTPVKHKSKSAKLSPRQKLGKLIGSTTNSPKTKLSPRKRQLAIRSVNVTPTKYKKFPFQSSASPARRSTRSRKGETHIDIHHVANFVSFVMMSYRCIIIK